MYTVPEQLSELAGTCLGASQTVADAWTGALSAFGPVAGAAGNTTGASTLGAAHTTATEAADLAFGRFMSVLEQDMDDLYAVAFDMTTTDEATAATYGAGATGPDAGPSTPRGQR